MKGLKILAVMAVVLMLSSMALAEVNIGADVEINTDFQTSTQEKSTAAGSDTDMTTFTQGGRVRLTVSGKTEADSGLYASLQGQLMANDDGTMSTDDAFIELGNASWYMRAGRVEGESLFAKGQDIYIVGAPLAPGRYEANNSRGRTNLGAVLAVMPSDALTVEVDTVYGNSGDNNILGARPLIKFSTSGLTVKGGVDYYMESPQDNNAKGETTKLGFGGNAEYGMGAITLGASAAMVTVGGKDSADKDLDDESTLSLFGYATMSMGAGTLGVGGGMTSLSYDKAKTEKSMIEAYVSFDAPLPVDGAALKLGASYASATVEKQGGGLLDQDTSAFGGRVRLWYEIPSM